MSLNCKIPSSSESFSPSLVSLALSSETAITPLFCLSIMDRAVRISLSGSSCFVCLYIMFRKVEKSNSAFLSGKIRAGSLGTAQFCSLDPDLSIPLLCHPCPPRPPVPLPGAPFPICLTLVWTRVDQCWGLSPGLKNPSIALLDACSETL